MCSMVAHIGSLAKRHKYDTVQDTCMLGVLVTHFTIGDLRTHRSRFVLTYMIGHQDTYEYGGWHRDSYDL